MKHSNLLAPTLFLLGACVCLTSSAGATQTFVSLKGDFYINYPDDWTEVDYTIVDTYLRQSGAGTAELDYETVLAPRSAEPFFTREYLILTVDTVGTLNAKAVDSVMRNLAYDMGAVLKNRPADRLFASLEEGVLNFHAESGTATMLKAVTEFEGAVKMHLLALRVYERGLAWFYFYAPDTLLESNLPLFQEIVHSFSTESVEEALQREDVRIADLKEDRRSSGPSRLWLYFGAAVVLILIVIIRRLF